MQQTKDYSVKSHLDDNLDTFISDGHKWEVGHFGERNNGYSAFGFRQDGLCIRITSKYEAEFLGRLISDTVSR